MNRKWFDVPKKAQKKDLRTMLGRLYNFRYDSTGKQQFRRKSADAVQRNERKSWIEVWQGGGGSLSTNRTRLQILNEKLKPKNKGMEWKISWINGEYILKKRRKNKGRI